MIFSVINFFLVGFYKAVPVILTNLSPVLIAKVLPTVDYPVDFNKELPDGKRLFGAHKTWRGVITMLFTGLLTGFLFFNSFYWGLLIALGVIIGDLLTSVIKRRVNLKPGASFEPWDSEILMVSTMLIAWGLFNIYEMIGIIILAPLAYKGFNVLGYLLKLQKHPW